MICLAALAGCQKEKVEFPGATTQTTTSGEETEPEVTNPLTIVASIRSLEDASRANIVTAWQTEHTMGLYTDGNNLSYTYNGREWMPKSPYQVDKEQEIFGYYPYSEEKPENGYVKIDLTRQDDVLWGKTRVTPDFPQARLEMTHSMCLLRIKLLRDEYKGTGRVDKVIATNFPETAWLSLSNGYVSLRENTPRTDVQLGGAFMLNDTAPVVTELILPISAPEGYEVKFFLDGKELTYQFPRDHVRKAGYIYTYTIRIKGEYNSEINVNDVPMDVEHWRQFGKTDEIVWKYPENNGVPGWENIEDLCSIQPNYCCFGYDTYQNEGKAFGTYYFHYGTPGTFKGNMRFVLMQGEKIVEKFQPSYFTAYTNWGGKAIQCYVTSPPGRYRLVPLFQREGETTWFKAVGYQGIGTDEEWMYEVKPPAPDDLPALRHIYLEEEGNNMKGRGYRIPFNKDFGVVYILSNKGRKALRGKIKAVWERQFKLKSNSYRPSSKKEGSTNDNEWKDEIGMMEVSIPAGVRFWKGLIGCRVTRYYPQPKSPNNVEYAGAELHLYWQPEGASGWTLLRLDAEPLFNTDYEDPSVWYYTLNFINVGLKEWYEKG